MWANASNISLLPLYCKSNITLFSLFLDAHAHSIVLFYWQIVFLRSAEQDSLAWHELNV